MENIAGREGSFFEVDLSLLKENFKKLQKIAPKKKIIFMVKANAYGHGAIPVVEYCVTELGIREFGVATIGEGLELRYNLEDLEFEIYLFSEFDLKNKKHIERVLDKRLIPVISNFNDLKLFIENPQFKYFPLFLKFNTGMNRLGISSEECDEVVKYLKANDRTEIFHLCSHFACSSQSYKNKSNQRQNETFKNIKAKFESDGLKILNSSLSNSGAIEQNLGMEETHIRPGLMLYGPSSLIDSIRNTSPWKGKIISVLKAQVLKKTQMKKGDPVGYGATPLPCSGTLLIIALGYGDGFSTLYQSVELSCGEAIGKVAGRVNMDMAQIIFPEGSTNLPEVGEIFNVWDHNPESLYRISSQRGTITYELFCEIGQRVPRVYKKS
ncbi:MAG: alanine racemase [Halobacteriovoraceae bacterium]|nr:alanine racemase [Halobacteriovoraceae bacterium]